MVRRRAGSAGAGVRGRRAGVMVCSCWRCRGVAAIARVLRGDRRRGPRWRWCAAGPVGAAAVRDLWPEVVDHLGLRHPRRAVAARGARAARRARPGRAAAGVRAFAEDYRATGRFVDCLDALKARLADPVADRIVEALRLTREVGGTDLGRLLRTLSTFLREDARTRGELEARQSWTVNAARLAVAAPWIVLALLATRPEAVTAYNRPAGRRWCSAVGGAGSVVAYR